MILTEQEHNTRMTAFIRQPKQGITIAVLSRVIVEAAMYIVDILAEDKTVPEKIIARLNESGHIRITLIQTAGRSLTLRRGIDGDLTLGARHTQVQSVYLDALVQLLELFEIPDVEVEQKRVDGAEVYQFGYKLRMHLTGLLGNYRNPGHAIEEEVLNRAVEYANGMPVAEQVRTVLPIVGLLKMAYVAKETGLPVLRQLRENRGLYFSPSKPFGVVMENPAGEGYLDFVEREENVTIVDGVFSRKVEGDEKKEVVTMSVVAKLADRVKPLEGCLTILQVLPDPEVGDFEIYGRLYNEVPLPLRATVKTPTDELNFW